MKKGEFYKSSNLSIWPLGIYMTLYQYILTISLSLISLDGGLTLHLQMIKISLTKDML